MELPTIEEYEEVKRQILESDGELTKKELYKKMEEKIKPLEEYRRYYLAAVPIFHEYDLKEAIQEIYYHRVCLQCRLNLCNCGKGDWVIDWNVAKEVFGLSLTNHSQAGVKV